MTKIHNDLINKMYALSAQAQNKPATEALTNTNNFKSQLQNALSGINELQQNSSELKTRFEKGDAEVSLAKVMIAQEKAHVGFQAALQVRNKLVRAYQDIMNMPV